MKNKNKLYTLILVLFIILSLLIGSHHEVWPDETQSWLIARDSSLYNLFFNYLHAEGHPALWYLILKLFLLCGLDCDHIYLVSTFFSSVGVGIFLFKSKFPNYIKCLIPFTYFVFYQYTVITRSYCLVFILLSILASIWEKRKEKNFLFSLILILLMNTEAHLYFFALSVYLYYLYDFIKNKQEISNKRKYVFSLIIILLFFIITALYVFPYKKIIDPNMLIQSSEFYISLAFFTPWHFGKNIILLSSIIFLIFMFFVYLRNKEKLYCPLLLSIPLFLFFEFCYHSIWHYGIIFIIFIFIIWIKKMENVKEIKIFLIFVCIIQVFWSVKSSYYDFFNRYSSAKEVAKFIEKYDYKNMKIYGESFYCNSLNAYFSKNIYYNWDDVGFFNWSIKGKYFLTKKEEHELLKEKPEIIVESKFSKKINGKYLLRDYNEYTFYGYSYVENKKYEDMTFNIYVLKTVDKMHKKSLL